MQTRFRTYSKQLFFFVCQIVFTLFSTFWFFRAPLSLCSPPHYPPLLKTHSPQLCSPMTPWEECSAGPELLEKLTPLAWILAKCKRSFSLPHIMTVAASAELTRFPPPSNLPTPHTHRLCTSVHSCVCWLAIRTWGLTQTLQSSPSSCVHSEYQHSSSLAPKPHTHTHRKKLDDVQKFDLSREQSQIPRVTGDVVSPFALLRDDRLNKGAAGLQSVKVADIIGYCYAVPAEASGHRVGSWFPEGRENTFLLGELLLRICWIVPATDSLWFKKVTEPEAPLGLLGKWLQGIWWMILSSTPIWCPSVCSKWMVEVSSLGQDPAL